MKKLLLKIALVIYLAGIPFSYQYLKYEYQKHFQILGWTTGTRNEHIFMSLVWPISVPEMYIFHNFDFSQPADW